MKEIYSSNIDSCLNKILITLFSLQENISLFEYYKDNIEQDEILHNPDFIEAKAHIKKSKVLIQNLYIKNS